MLRHPSPTVNSPSTRTLKMTENIALYERIGYVEYERRQEQALRRALLRQALASSS